MARPVRLENVQVITFDCYGTLIDWEGGARQTVRGLLEKSPAHLPSGVPLDEVLDNSFQAWERAQWERIHGTYARYRDIAREALVEVAAVQGLPLGVNEGAAFADSIATWKPFPDTVAALRKLKQAGLRLGIISNIDDDILQATVQQLGVEFDLLMTAQQARAYKPSPVPFQRALGRLGVPPAQIAHAAFGFEYDIGPAAALGLRTILVRRSRVDFPPQPVPDLVVANLTELASLFE
ncbi:MAG TPA: haloacid dehalogenase type II [Candidatus Xenobia bacterium]|nr:haloacid dehalogenase type II [Candidatus Xenobia bacterium]